MFVVVTYDVNTESREGRRRLRNVAKVCKNFGVRVQNSVFECTVDYAQFLDMKNQISEIINPEQDSIRYYNLGNDGRRRVEHFGTKFALNVDEPIIL